MTQRPVAIITGAGSGIGRATAMRLATSGYDVALIGRTESKLRDTASQVSGGAATLIHPTDVSDAPQCDAAVDATVKRFGRIDVLINAAGYAARASIAETTDAFWRKTIDANATSVVAMTRAVWPHFIERKSGFVVNISSMASIDPFAGFGAYGAAKAAVNLFTLMTAREGSSHGIKAVCIAPGAVETPMLRSMFDESMVPRDTTLSADDVASCIVECIAGRRMFKPGETITLMKSD